MSIDLASLIVNSIVAFCTVIAIWYTARGLGIARDAMRTAQESQAQTIRDSIIARTNEVGGAYATLMEAYTQFNASLQPFWKNKARLFGDSPEDKLAAQQVLLQAESDVHRGVHMLGSSCTRLAFQLEAVRAIEPQAWHEGDFNELREWVKAAGQIWLPHYLALVSDGVDPAPQDFAKFIDTELDKCPSSLRAVIATRVARDLSENPSLPFSSLTNQVFEIYWERLEAAVSEFLDIAYRLASFRTGSHSDDISAAPPSDARFGVDALSPTRTFTTLPTAETFGSLREARAASTGQPSVIYRMNNGVIARADTLAGVAQQIIPDLSRNMHNPGDRIKQSAARRAAQFQSRALTEWLKEHSLSELPAEALRILLQPKDADFNGMVIESGSVASWDYPVKLFLVDSYLNGDAPRGNVHLIKATTLEDYLGNFGRLIYDDGKPQTPLAERPGSEKQD